MRSSLRADAVHAARKLPGNVVSERMICTRDGKDIPYPQVRREHLSHLVDDPDELWNLADVPAALS